MSRDDIKDELGLGATMLLNSWHINQAGAKHCAARSICELG